MRDISTSQNTALYKLHTSESKVKYTSICIAHRRNYLQCAQVWITQFYLQITRCLPLLPTRRASPPTEGRRLSRPGEQIAVLLLNNHVTSTGSLRNFHTRMVSNSLYFRRMMMSYSFALWRLSSSSVTPAHMQRNSRGGSTRRWPSNVTSS